MTPHKPQESPGPACILNGHSIHVQEAQASLARIADELRVPVQVIVTRKGDDISSLAARAVSDNRQPVVAGGGDGTVNAVAGALAGTDVALGVLPMGTLNHFAKDVGIPRNLEAAARNVFTGQITEVDVGEVNGRVFVNNSGLGFYPRFVRLREQQEQHGHVKRAAFMLAVRQVVRGYFRLRMRLHADQAEELEHMTPFFFVGNNRYEISGLKIGTRCKLDSGRLWVCTLPRTGRQDLVRVAVRTFLGRESEQELSTFEVAELSVDPGTARVDVSTDGEVSVMSTPLRYRIRPRALRVVAPA
jgi:diacylglycerol kinase family enzyme